MGSEQSESVRSEIVIPHKEELSLHQIMVRLKVSKGAAQGTLQRFAKTRPVFPKARSERQKVTTPPGDQYNKLSCLRDRKETSSQIQNLLNTELRLQSAKGPTAETTSHGDTRTNAEVRDVH